MSKVIGIDASRANNPKKTGVERYAFEVIQRLKGIIPADVKVRLYSREPLQGELAALPANWTSHVLRWPPKRLWTQFRLSWEMFVRPPDLLFVPAHILPSVLPDHTVVTLHDVAFMSHPESYKTHGSPYNRLGAHRAVRKASRIVTVSEFSKREIVKWFGALPAQIVVTPLAPDHAEYHAMPLDEAKHVAAQHGLPGPYFLFVGRLEQKKNLAGLLAAYKEYKTTLPEAPEQLALIGGRGTGYDREIAEITGWSGAGDVRELGFVPEADMAAMYAGATALLLPSWYEGFGLPVVEAFACGTPVIASNAAALPEVSGHAALLVDPAEPSELAEAMARVAGSEKLREELSKKGLARAKEFSWDACARETWAALRGALDDPA